MTAQYIEMLVEKYPEIQAIWLIGSRANDQENPESDWDYLVFADRNLLEILRVDTDLHEPDIDLLVVYDGNSFEEPWTEEGEKQKKGSLRSWEWRVDPDNERLARYDDRGHLANIRYGRAGNMVLAKKLWPPAD